ncbi:unnamed protein product, partial [Choristocarpus tenellus]
AYRAAALETHPDKNPGDAEAKTRFQRVSEAYKRLTDPTSAEEENESMSEEEIISMFNEAVGRELVRMMMMSHGAHGAPKSYRDLMHEAGQGQGHRTRAKSSSGTERCPPCEENGVMAPDADDLENLDEIFAMAMKGVMGGGEQKDEEEEDDEEEDEDLERIMDTMMSCLAGDGEDPTTLAEEIRNSVDEGAARSFVMISRYMSRVSGAPPPAVGTGMVYDSGTGAESGGGAWDEDSRPVLSGSNGWNAAMANVRMQAASLSASDRLRTGEEQGSDSHNTRRDGSRGGDGGFGTRETRLAMDSDGSTCSSEDSRARGEGSLSDSCDSSVSLERDLLGYLDGDERPPSDRNINSTFSQSFSSLNSLASIGPLFGGGGGGGSG